MCRSSTGVCFGFACSTFSIFDFLPLVHECIQNGSNHQVEDNDDDKIVENEKIGTGPTSLRDQHEAVGNNASIVDQHKSIEDPDTTNKIIEIKMEVI